MSNRATHPESIMRRLRTMYPGVNNDELAFFLEAMNFDEQSTLVALVDQFGQPAPGTVSALASNSAPVSSIGTKQTAKYSIVASTAPKPLPESKKQPSGPLPTYLPGGMITGLTEMARANGCDKSQSQIYAEFMDLYTKWTFRLNDEIHKSTNVPSRMRVHYVNEISRAKSARTAVETEIFEKSLWWNDYLNEDVIDLHGLLVEQAKWMLGQRIKKMKRVTPSKARCYHWSRQQFGWRHTSDKGGLDEDAERAGIQAPPEQRGMHSHRLFYSIIPRF